MHFWCPDFWWRTDALQFRFMSGLWALCHGLPDPCDYYAASGSLIWKGVQEISPECFILSAIMNREKICLMKYFWDHVVNPVTNQQIDLKVIYLNRHRLTNRTVLCLFSTRPDLTRLLEKPDNHDNHDILRYIFHLHLFYHTVFGKNDLNKRVLAAFQGSGWGKSDGEKSLDLRGFGSQWARCIPTAFWQLKWNSGVFSTGTENEDFAGFSGIGQGIGKGKRVWNGLVFIPRHRSQKGYPFFVICEVLSLVIIW